MNELVRKTLREIVAKDRTLLTDARRCKSLLRDLCLHCHKEIHLVICAQEEGVVDELLSSTSSVPQGLLIARLVSKLQEHRSQTECASVWAVETWAIALGLNLEIVQSNFHEETLDPDNPFKPEIAYDPQDALRHAIRNALSEGNLSAQKKESLQVLRQQLGISPAHASHIFQEESLTRRPPTAITFDLEPDVNLELVLISAGKFTMGSPPNEQGRFPTETQQETVIPRPFYMGKYEVTQAQYKAVTGLTPSHFKGPQRPVEQVSWNDAKEFCRKLSAKIGRTAELPTEAEWEYACRAGTKTRFYTGDSEADLLQAAWYDANANSKTQIVGLKQPNAFGLYDMHGNVWEWCDDIYEPTGTGASSPSMSSSNLPMKDAAKKTVPDRALRGGSWLLYPMNCRSACRFGYNPDRKFISFGFRIVVRV